MFLTAADKRCFPGPYPCDHHPVQCCCKHDGSVKCSPDGSLWISNSIGKKLFVTCYKGIVVLGYGPYLHKTNTTSSFILPREVSDPCNVTQTACEVIKRKGTVCGKCMSGYTVSVNTYDLKCVPDKECN